MTAAKKLEPLDIADAPARPFVKWAGGKTQLLAELRKRTPAFGHYFEPFAGGAALFYSLAGSSPSRGRWANLNDSNSWLVDAYTQIRDDVESVIEALRGYERRYRLPSGGEEYYYKVRALGSPRAPVERAACLIFLNKTGYNGLWRVNGKTGAFNVPHGKRKGQVTICDEDNLRRVSKALAHATLTSADFEVAASRATRGDFVYFDPPYVPRSADSDFTAYTKEPFGPAEQERLMGVALELKKRGVRVMLSNADVPFVRKLYRPTLGFTVEKVSAVRHINSNADKRGPVGEVIIT